MTGTTHEPAGLGAAEHGPARPGEAGPGVAAGPGAAGPGETGGDPAAGGGVAALSGRAVSELTLEAVRRGEVGVPDLRIHPDTLEHQAAVAERHANPQLAGNLRRAAELTALTDEEVLSIYEALRPGRVTPAELTALAGSLAARGLPRCAALVAEAAEVYARRGLSA
jgi:propanediol dehydratase small subunit